MYNTKWGDPQISVRVPPEQLRILKAMARRQGCTLSYLIRCKIDELTEAYQQQDDSEDA